MDVAKLKLYKVEHKHTDPIRFPAVIEPYENEFKKDYLDTVNNIVKQTTDLMIKQIKHNDQNL